ncbi:septal ring lytic transglycosylase RlpA family protein [Reyranella sp.]|uniref:septal ring lytic transglycosylase RlpA family protein n=1 Tax=Reyranella sp. TaxID=1929291 RepID=UPI003BA9CC4E
MRLGGALLLAASVAACGSTSGSRSSSASAAQRGSYKVGSPYKIDGVSYTPQESFTLVETGVASWYGPGFHGKSTANGERYDQSDRTAAHRTLQMPAIVRVTNLDNGRTTVVRINDRGPFARNRIIDLSRTAAEELDVVRRGTAHVRVEVLGPESMAVRDVAMSGGGPSEQYSAMARAASGNRSAAPVVQAAAPPPPPPPVASSPQPAPVVQAAWSTTQQPPTLQAPPLQVPSSDGRPTVATLAAASAPAGAGAPIVSSLRSGGFYVQTGSFSSADNAERQRELVRSYGASEVSQASAGGREVYRVRLGPYTTPDAAGIVADRLKRSGYGDARVVSE